VKKQRIPSLGATGVQPTAEFFFQLKFQEQQANLTWEENNKQNSPDELS
jgi:hypothetical protein